MELVKEPLRHQQLVTSWHEKLKAKFSFWKRLTLTQRIALISLTLLILIIPLTIFIVLKPTRLFSKAYVVTPPVTPPTETPNPYPTPSCHTEILSQTISNGAYNLPTTYSAFVQFTPSFTGTVQKIEVKAGMWGTNTGTLTCKLQNPTGKVLGETNTASFNSSSGGAFRQLNFAAAMDLTQNTTYTLYCRKTDGTNYGAYWNYNTANNLKTYQVYLNVCSGTPTPTPTQGILPTSSCRTELLSQTVSNSSYNLPTTYSTGASVSFIPSFTGNVQKIEVKAGMWNVNTGTLTCKLTDSNKNTLTGGETNTASFKSSSGGAWRQLNFPTTLNLTKNTTYTLYCRKTAGTNYGAYWSYNTANNIKTYQVYMNICTSP